MFTFPFSLLLFTGEGFQGSWQVLPGTTLYWDNRFNELKMGCWPSCNSIMPFSIFPHFSLPASFQIHLLVTFHWRKDVWAPKILKIPISKTHLPKKQVLKSLHYIPDFFWEGVKSLLFWNVYSSKCKSFCYLSTYILNIPVFGIAKNIPAKIFNRI